MNIPWWAFMLFLVIFVFWHEHKQSQLNDKWFDECERLKRKIDELEDPVEEDD